MGSRTACLGLLLFLCAVVACGPTARDSADDQMTGDDDAGNDQHDGRSPPPDATPIDGGNPYPDAEPYDDGGSCTDWVCESPVPLGCLPPGSDDICGNGLDDNCNGHVDESCGCTSGAVQQCFLGPPGHRGVGACVDGMQVCEGSGEFTHWGECEGGIRPTDEACDSQDNDCNGCEDDNPACCVVNIACPDSSQMPEGSPFVDYVIDGTDFYSGTAQSWAWTVTGGPCDELFISDGLPPSYDLTGQNTSTLTISPTLSGDYTVTMTVVTSSGTYTCTFIVHIAGPGLRVELCSDVSENTDLDLHVHKPGTTTAWFGPLGNPSNDDCFYWNCTPTDTGVNWGYANSGNGACPSPPCRNPRLDIDSIQDDGVPENTNIDAPANNATFRVMVHYYGGGTVVAHPMIDIYCGGHWKASYGRFPDVLTNFDQSGGYGGGDMWRVVDVTTIAGGTDCNLTPLHPPGQPNDYYVTTNNTAY